MFEKLIASYCAPALAGIKPANIVTIQKTDFPNIYDEIEKINRDLNPKDIYLDILAERQTSVMVMVYRKKY